MEFIKQYEGLTKEVENELMTKNNKKKKDCNGKMWFLQLDWIFVKCTMCQST